MTVGWPSERALEVSVDETINKPLRVASLIASKRDDEDRGPMVFIHPEDASSRLLVDGELAWVYGPRRHELATVRLEPEMVKGDVILRDVVGAAPLETICVI